MVYPVFLDNRLLPSILITQSTHPIIPNIMGAPELQYRTLQVRNKALHKGGTSVRGKAIGSAVELLHSVSFTLNRWAVGHRIKSELRRMDGDIRKAIANYEAAQRQSNPQIGVLVVAGVQEWERPDPTGSKAQTFLSIHIGGIGTNYTEVVRKYRNTPKMVQGAPDGWVRKDAYIWVTR